MYIIATLLPIALFVSFVLWKFRLDIEDEKAFRSKLSGLGGNIIEPR